MALTREERQRLIEEYRDHEKDTGSTAIQIAILSTDIRALTEHLKKHKKDHHTQTGLMKKVGRRNRLLRYLHRQSPETYREVVSKLGLRAK
jgi:small subunit ribosomal protein S15